MTPHADAQHDGMGEKTAKLSVVAKRDLCSAVRSLTWHPAHIRLWECAFFIQSRYRAHAARLLAEQ